MISRCEESLPMHIFLEKLQSSPGPVQELEGILEFIAMQQVTSTP